MRFLLISLMLPPVAPQTGLRAMVNVVHVRTDYLAGERTCKRGDCVSHLASAGEPALATFATTAVEAEERQTTAADAALVSCIIMTRTQAMREEEYRDG